jgi:ribosomal protein S18
MARETVTIECTEARKEGKSPSRYTTTPQQEIEDRENRAEEIQPRACAATRCTAKSNKNLLCHAKPIPTKKSAVPRPHRHGEMRTPRPKPKIDFTVDALDFKNTNLLKQFVTDQGRILPRKYTGLPAPLSAPG